MKVTSYIDEQLAIDPVRARLAHAYAAAGSFDHATRIAASLHGSDARLSAMALIAAELEVHASDPEHLDVLFDAFQASLNKEH